MPNIEGPGDLLRRAVADSQSVLFGADDATVNRLLEFAETRVPLGVDELIRRWETWATGDHAEIDASQHATAIADRDALGWIVPMFPASLPALAVRLRSADQAFWRSTVNFNRDVPAQWWASSWWEARAPAALGGQTSAPSGLTVTAVDRVRALTLQRALSFRRRAVDMSGAQTDLRDRLFSRRRSEAPTGGDIVDALVELRALVSWAVPQRAATAKALDVSTWLPEPFDLPEPPVVVARNMWPWSTSPADIERARVAALAAMDQLLTDEPGPDHEDPRPRRQAPELPDNPLAFATALAREQDACDLVAGWCADPDSMLFELDAHSQQRLVESVVPLDHPSSPDNELEGWETCTQWDGLEPGTSYVERLEFVNCAARRSALAGLERVLPPTLPGFAERLQVADQRWETRTIGVARTLAGRPARSPAPWWSRRVPRYLPDLFTRSLASATPKVWAELQERGIADDPQFNPPLEPWKAALGMTLERPAGETPLLMPPSQVLAETEDGGTFGDVRERLTKWATGTPYVVPTVDEIRDILREIARLIDEYQPRPATVRMLLTDTRPRPRPSAPDPRWPWTGDPAGLPLARSAARDALNRILTGSWESFWDSTPRFALVAPVAFARERENAASLRRAADDPRSALYGLGEVDQGLLLDALVGRQISQRGDYRRLDQWRAGESFIDARLAAWEHLIRWAENASGHLSTDRILRGHLLDVRDYLARLATVIPPHQTAFHDKLRTLDTRYWNATQPHADDDRGYMLQPREGAWWRHRLAPRLNAKERAEEL